MDINTCIHHHLCMYTYIYILQTNLPKSILVIVSGTVLSSNRAEILLKTILSDSVGNLLNKITLQVSQR